MRRGTGAARDRQERLQGRRVIPLSRRTQNAQDAATAKQIAAEVVADLKARRETPLDPPARTGDNALLVNDGGECPGCGTVTDDHGEDCAYEWDEELREYVLQTETPD